MKPRKITELRVTYSEEKGDKWQLYVKPDGSTEANPKTPWFTNVSAKDKGILFVTISELNKETQETQKMILKRFKDSKHIFEGDIEEDVQKPKRKPKKINVSEK